MRYRCATSALVSRLYRTRPLRRVNRSSETGSIHPGTQTGSSARSPTVRLVLSFGRFDLVRQNETTAVLSKAFGAVAGDYDRLRPGPSPEALDWLVPAGARDALEIGAGTGILTRLLAERLEHVTAVEPDDRMRAVSDQSDVGDEGRGRGRPSGSTAQPRRFGRSGHRRVGLALGRRGAGGARGGAGPSAEWAPLAGLERSRSLRRLDAESLGRRGRVSRPEEAAETDGVEGSPCGGVDGATAARFSPRVHALPLAAADEQGGPGGPRHDLQRGHHHGGRNTPGRISTPWPATSKLSRSWPTWTWSKCRCVPTAGGHAAAEAERRRKSSEPPRRRERRSFRLLERRVLRHAWSSTRRTSTSWPGVTIARSPNPQPFLRIVIRSQANSTKRLSGSYDCSQVRGARCVMPAQGGGSDTRGRAHQTHEDSTAQRTRHRRSDCRARRRRGAGRQRGHLQLDHVGFGNRKQRDELERHIVVGQLRDLGIHRLRSSGTRARARAPARAPDRAPRRTAPTWARDRAPTPGPATGRLRAVRRLPHRARAPARRRGRNPYGPRQTEAGRRGPVRLPRLTPLASRVSTDQAVAPCAAQCAHGELRQRVVHVHRDVRQLGHELAAGEEAEVDALERTTSPSR